MIRTSVGFVLCTCLFSFCSSQEMNEETFGGADCEAPWNYVWCQPPNPPPTVIGCGNHQFFKATGPGEDRVIPVWGGGPNCVNYTGYDNQTGAVVACAPHATDSMLGCDFEWQ